MGFATGYASVEEWRVAPEGQPLTAKRCTCFEPLLDGDADGFISCLRCGRVPSIRLPSSEDLRGYSAFRRTAPSLSSAKRVKNPHAMKGNKFVGFWMPPELAEDLKGLARSRERSVSAELRIATRAHVQNENGDATPPKGGASKDVASREPVNAQE